MTSLKNIFLICLIFLVSNCSLKNSQHTSNINRYFIEIETPNDKNNLYYKENLIRLFHNNNYDATKKYILKTKISFQSAEVLSVGGQNNLKSIKANISYELKNVDTDKILKSGLINTFPALSSTSRSHYSQDNNIRHIQQRLIKSSAKSIYMHINLLIRRLR